jgi:transcriptional regulator with GAF, ATPase, and Fis domain/tetratricopeptide (TPR) repeat protein
MTIHRAELAFAVAGTPLSLDALVEWGLARPAELWALMEDARAAGRIAEDGERRGCFSFCNSEHRKAALESAGGDDYQALAAVGDLNAPLFATARWLGTEGCFRCAAEIYRALLAAAPEDAFPGGKRGWLVAAVEVSRIYPEMYGLDAPTIDRAIEIAAACGDIGAQCLLDTARGLNTIFAGDHEQARAFFRRAMDTVQTQPSQIRSCVHLRIAAGLVRQGRLQEAIDVFEELLGDVPDEQLRHAGDLIEPGAAAPASAIANVAFAYTNTGQYARALEILHRVLARAEELGRTSLIMQMHLFIAMQHFLWDDAEKTRLSLDPAWAHYRTSDSEPMHTWYAGVMEAWLRSLEGKLDEVRALVSEAQQARLKVGAPPLMGPVLFRIEERAGLEAFDGTGLDLLAEVERVLAVRNPYVAGMGHRLLARRLAVGPLDDARAATIRDHFEQAIAFQKESGAVLELVRALADAAIHAHRCGRSEEAQALAEEERKVRSTFSRSENEGQRQSRFAQVILDLGRVSPPDERQPAMWGEIAARLSRGFGAEQVALIEAGPPPRLLAARGGEADWGAKVLELATNAAGGAQFQPVDEQGLRVLVPFVAQGLQRKGTLALENRLSPMAISSRDRPLLESLGVQLGVLFGNVLLWRELSQARERLEQENRYYRETVPAAPSGTGLVAHSPAMAEVLALVSRVAASAATVLILGESGVGKELIAQEVHRQSARRDGPFIAVHIASLAPGLVASALFGHERGAFTGATQRCAGRFELADHGTIFLDEVGELSLDDQVRLLRVLQEGTMERVGGTRPIRADFRVVAATNRDLEAEVRAGRFREDLFFRINAFPVCVPPLRARPEEIPTLALYFMERFARSLGRSLEGISETDMSRLLAYAWPGNVRELEHVIQRSVLLSDGPRLRIAPLESANLAGPHAPSRGQAPADDLISLAEAERRHITRVLLHSRGRITGVGGAAEILQINPSTLNFRIAKLGLRNLLAQARRQPRRKGKPPL